MADVDSMLLGVSLSLLESDLLDFVVLVPPKHKDVASLSILLVTVVLEEGYHLSSEVVGIQIQTVLLLKLEFGVVDSTFVLQLRLVELATAFVRLLLLLLQQWPPWQLIVWRLLIDTRWLS